LNSDTKKDFLFAKIAEKKTAATERCLNETGATISTYPYPNRSFDPLVASFQPARRYQGALLAST
jgi:hypothetical protein